MNTGYFLNRRKSNVSNPVIKEFKLINSDSEFLAASVGMLVEDIVKMYSEVNPDSPKFFEFNKSMNPSNIDSIGQFRRYIEAAIYKILAWKK